MAFRRVQEENIQDIYPKGRFRRLESESQPQDRGQSIASSGLKGLIRGLKSAGETYGGEDTISEVLRDVYGADPETRENLRSERDIQSEKQLNRALPSREGYFEDIAERGLKMVPGIVASPGGAASKAGQVIGGTLLGDLAKRSDLGPWGEMAAEILGSAVGGSPSSVLKPKPGSRQEQLINTAKGRGLTDRQITPAIQSERKVRGLSPIAHRGKATIEPIVESRNALGGIYREMQNSAAGKKQLSYQEKVKLLNDISQEAQNVPRAFREKIDKDAMDLLNSNGTVADLMNFYWDVNANYGKTEGRLGGIRQILENHITPHLGQEFVDVNNLYANVKRLGIRLRPDLASRFHDLRIANRLAEGIVSGDTRKTTRIMAEILSKFTASKFLVSPYMQHIPRKVLESAQRGSPESARKFLEVMLNKTSDKDYQD